MFDFGKVFLTKTIVLTASIFFASHITFAQTTKVRKTDFQVPTSLQDRVDFWIDIYSKYTTTQGVFHNIQNPSLIYGEVDLTTIYNNSVLNESSKDRLAQVKIDLARLKIARQWKIKNPKSIRLQMGLKDRMEKAIYLSGKYLPMMEKVFKEKNLPIDLTRLVFVESSFNVFAQSKVGASGLWQIMPHTARPEGYLKSHYDKRNHPYYATRLAAEILAENYRSTKSWPLAITAYNHGLTGVKRMVNKVGTSDIAGLIQSHSRTASWGFASENFYACFLAVLEVEKNANDLFGKNIAKSKPLRTKNVYLKTAMTQKKVLKAFDGDLQKFRNLNPHIFISKFKKEKVLPAGVPLVLPADESLYY